MESKYKDDGAGAYWDGTPEEEQAWLTDSSRLRAIAKIQRQALVGAIRVTTSTGKVFDGDEVSQTRMARAIIGMQVTGQPTIVWVLADNTPTEATLAELTEAMCLAGQAQASVWII